MNKTITPDKRIESAAYAAYRAAVQRRNDAFYTANDEIDAVYAVYRKLKDQPDSRRTDR